MANKLRLALAGCLKIVRVYNFLLVILSVAGKVTSQLLAQYENTKAGDVLAETSERVCVERSVLVLTAAEFRKEMEKPLPGSRGPQLPTMMLPSAQNPGAHDEHFCVQDPAHPYRRAVVKQELADVRRSHRLDVKRNAYESQWEQIHKISPTSSVRSFQSRASASLLATFVEGDPTALRDKIWNRRAAAELQKATRPSQSFRNKSLGAMIVPEDSTSQADTDDMDDFGTKGGFRWLTSAEKVLKSKLLLETLMSGIHLSTI